MQDTDRTIGSNATIGASNRTVGGPDDSATLMPTEQSPTLPLGTLLAGRYQIVDLLGVGGMGAVYKAFDRQLTRVVALKTILPELAATPVALKRFKQEVLLAQSIVHKNVVRIFDIGEDGPTKFITMDFVEGRDLKHLIKERGKLPAAEAAVIIRQVCQGLEAAHAAGVVHRDLKPQNIMIEGDGHIVVMDFGIAHSGNTRGATQTGAFLGTPEYMSPEQAQSEDVDARSDIFSLGLILYELLTGKLPYQGKTVLETMFKRTQERAVPPAEIDATVPKGANEIVIKCLQMKPADRYQSVTEMLQDVETFDPTKKIGTADRAKTRLRKAARYRNTAIAAALVVLALAAGFLLRNRFSTPAPATATAAHAPELVLVADFINHTDETVFDGALESVVKMGLEGAGFITAYDRNQLKSLGAPPFSGKLDEPKARQNALLVGLGVVVTGSLDRRGQEYVISLKATQTVTGNTILSSEETASNKDKVLFAAGKLAATVRKALGDDTSEANQRFAMETLTATSLEAIHEYSTAMQALSSGSADEALKSFSKAIDIDQNFGLAYAGMAIASKNLNQQQEAEKYVKLALGHMDHMTERERYRTRAMYYLVLKNNEKCVDEYNSLTTKFPSDTTAGNNLALCLTQLRNMPKAIQEMQRVTAIFPKRAVYRYNSSVYASYGGDFQAAEREAKQISATYPDAPIALAFAQLGQGQLTQAAETYQKLGDSSKLSPGSGLADIALYEGRFKDAAHLLEEGITVDLASKNSDRAATKLANLAYTRLLQGQTAQAVAAADKALANSQTISTRFLAGRIFAAGGQKARAQKLAAELGAELPSEPQAYGKIIQGEIALASGDARGAVKILSEANMQLDTWIGHFELGRAYLELGAFTEADSEFDRCNKRRGEAMSIFLDESPTYGYFPPVYYYMGRVREGLKSEGYTEWYRNYLSIRGKAGEDPLLAEIHKKLGS